jgi:oligopeptidase B
MKKINHIRYFLHFLSLGAVCLVVSCNTSKEASKPTPAAPVAMKIPFELESHGIKRIDNYFWMRLSDDQKNAAEKDEQTQNVLNYLNAENDYRKNILQHTETLQKNLFTEMKGRIQEKDESVPYSKNGYWYYTRFEEGQEYPIYCRKKGNLDTEEEILLNVNEMAEGYKYFQVGGLNISEDNNLLAFGVDTVSRRQYTIYVKDLKNNQIIGAPIPVTTGGSTWANDNKTLFYSKKDPVTLRSHKIFKHKLGGDPSKDELVYEEKDETFSTYIYKSKSKKYLIIGSSSTLTKYYQLLDANKPDGNLKEFSPRETGLEYSIYDFMDKFYIVTNWDAVNFRLMETSENNTHKSNWKEKIAHRPNVLLSSIEVFKDYLVLVERSDALVKMKVISQKDNSEYYVDFGEPAYTSFPTMNLDFDTEVLRYNYTSLTTPSSTYDFNMRTKEAVL